MPRLFGRRGRQKRTFPVPRLREGEPPPWEVPGPGPNFTPYSERTYHDAMLGLLVAADLYVRGMRAHHHLLVKEPALRFDPDWQESTFSVTGVFEDLATNCRSMGALSIPPRWSAFHEKFQEAFAVLSSAGRLIRQGIERNDLERYALGLKTVELHNNALNYEALPLMPR